MTFCTLSTRLVCALILCSGSLDAQPAAVNRRQAPPSDITALLETLRTLPRATHNSEIRVEPIASSAATRAWILSNEDDLRLYAPHGGQMDMDVQVSSILPVDAPPSFVTLLIESRGGTTPAGGPQLAEFVADGQPITLTQRAGAPSRSGDLLFLSTEVRVPFESFLRLAAASAVDGRIWGIPFRLLDRQIEILRAYAVRVAAGTASDANTGRGRGAWKNEAARPGVETGSGRLVLPSTERDAYLMNSISR